MILRAAIDAVDAGRLVRSALADTELIRALANARALDVIAVGKAAVPMLSAFHQASPVRPRTVLAIAPGAALATAGAMSTPANTEWFSAGHPLPSEESVRAARRALMVARTAGAADVLLVLLSGGGSALMALPAEGITLEDKQTAARTLMARGADIHELNTVRKHLSAIKGGQLAAAMQGRTIALAISDVVGDDLSVIASGPTVGDSSTFADALAVIDRHGGREAYPAPVVTCLEQGVAGHRQETPPSDSPHLARSTASIIGAQRGAVEGARSAAMQLGYNVCVLPSPVTGEARVAALQHISVIADRISPLKLPVCVISAGETTVTVSGTGVGGRNQEFALAIAPLLKQLGTNVVAASIGTDGVDGPTDAAGAVVDTTTEARARQSGIDAGRYLANNDTYTFFQRLGDLIRTGPTGTNVGDVQVILVAG